MDDPAVVVTEPRPLAPAAPDSLRVSARDIRRLLLGIEITLLGVILVIAAAGTSGAALGVVLGFVGLFVALSGA